MRRKGVRPGWILIRRIALVIPYWLAEPRPSLPIATVDDPEFVVVGAEATGLRRTGLAESGRRVRLYDAREVAGGASGRNGGFALRACLLRSM